MIGIEKQGQVVRIKRLVPENPPNTNLAKRGQVITFSRKSRRRMIDLQSRLDLEGLRVTFVTLTFHYTHSASETKAAFKRFREYIRYHYPQCSAMWRLEFQKRGTPHYHLIFFNLPYWSHKEMRATWMQCTGEDKSGVRVNLLKGVKQAMYYVSKYVAKMPDHEGTTLFINAPYRQKGTEQWTGRMWGVFNKEIIPLASRSVGVVESAELSAYFGWFVGTQISSVGRVRYGCLRLYSSDAKKIYEFCLKHGGFDVTECWRDVLQQTELSPATRTKASLFFAGVNTHH